MSVANDYREFLNSVRSGIGYWKSYSLLQFTLSITRVMRLDKVSGRKLASRLGISSTQVSKVLKGNENITIETMAKFAGALDAAVHIHVAKKGVAVRWTELPSEQAVIDAPCLQAAGVEAGDVSRFTYSAPGWASSVNPLSASSYSS